MTAAAFAKTALLTRRRIIDLAEKADLISRERITTLVSLAPLSGLEPLIAAIPLGNDKHRCSRGTAAK